MPDKKILAILRYWQFVAVFEDVRVALRGFLPTPLEGAVTSQYR
jgi:hypothetical protein